MGMTAIYWSAILVFFLFPIFWDGIPLSLSPMRLKDISDCSMDGSTLKVIAMACMLVDHAAFLFLPEGSPSCVALRTIGRISFPVFALMVSEAYLHTTNRIRYALTLVFFAFVTDIPWMLVFGQGHNVLFTLLAGYMGICCLDTLLRAARLHGSFLRGLLHYPLAAVLLMLLPLACLLLQTDFSYQGFLLVLCFHIFRGNLLMRMLFGLLIMSGEIIAGEVIAFTLLAFYNGERGFIKGRVAKYACYVFYPAHLLLLWCLKGLLL